MDTLQNFEFFYNVFMTTHLASHVNDFLKESNITLRLIQEKLKQRGYAKLEDVVQDLKEVCRRLKANKYVDPKLYDLFYEKMKFDIHEINENINFDV